MRVVPDKVKIFEAKIAKIAHCRIQFHPGKRTGYAAKLFPRLFEVVSVKMEVAEGMNEFSAR